MSNHLEQLVGEWLELKGYFVKKNIKVGRLSHGGFEGELDVVAYHPNSGHLIHVEQSFDAHTWAKREERFAKKFKAGQKYIIREVFPWLKSGRPIEQWAVLWASDKNHSRVAGGKVVPVWNLYNIIAQDIKALGSAAGNAISEQFPLLRTMQYTLQWVDNKQEA